MPPLTIDINISSVYRLRSLENYENELMRTLLFTLLQRTCRHIANLLQKEDERLALLPGQRVRRKLLHVTA